MTFRIRTVALNSFAALALAACASTSQTPPMTGSDAPATPPAPSQCNAAAAQSLVGEKAIAGNVELARQRAGAQVVRVIPPDTMVTMEFREGRLNVYTDAANSITRITCG